MWNVPVPKGTAALCACVPSPSLFPLCLCTSTGTLTLERLRLRLGPSSTTALMSSMHLVRTTLHNEGACPPTPSTVPRALSTSPPPPRAGGGCVNGQS